MKEVTVYTCSNGHLHYVNSSPKSCKICGSKTFGQINADMVDLEGDDGISTESRYYNS